MGLHSFFKGTFLITERENAENLKQAIKEHTEAEERRRTYIVHTV